MATSYAQTFGNPRIEGSGKSKCMREACQSWAWDLRRPSGTLGKAFSTKFRVAVSEDLLSRTEQEANARIIWAFISSFPPVSRGEYTVPSGEFWCVIHSDVCCLVVFAFVCLPRPSCSQWTSSQYACATTVQRDRQCLRL